MQALIRALAVVLLLLVAPAVVHAQIQTDGQSEVKIDKRKLLVPPRNPDGTLISTPFLEDPVQWVREKQQGFYGSINQAVHDIRTGNRSAATWSLLLISFAYGVFHAAGPGHGKVVISTWLIATESEFRRGLVLSFLSSLIQSLTAIVLVSVLFFLVASAAVAARNSVEVLESASYAMIAGLGLYLIYTAFRGSGHSHQPAPVTRHNDGHRSFEIVHRHADHQRAASQDHRLHGLVQHQFAFSPAGHSQPGHQHDAACGCGHSHGADPAQVRGDWSLSKALSMAFAIGIRPCTGAILVLVAANALGLYWAGILSVLAMGFGTFLTVSAIAAIAVFAKKLAMRLAARDQGLMDRLGFGLRLGGGLVVAAFGILLFWGSLGTSMNLT
jgi:ABC-type nickel/cobalt efflux system permease component RcnA